MHISDILNESMVIGDIDAINKESALLQLATRLSEHPHVPENVDLIYGGLLGRERLGSTGVGDGVAIPHAKIPGLPQLVACFARGPRGVAFDAIDQKPVKLFFVLLVPESSAGAHLKALARVSRLLNNIAFREALIAEPDPTALYATFIAEDNKH